MMSNYWLKKSISHFTFINKYRKGHTKTKENAINTKFV